MALSIDDWIQHAENQHLLLSEEEIESWPLHEPHKLYPVERTRFEHIENLLLRSLENDVIYTPAQLWSVAPLEIWTRTAPVKVVTHPYAMLPGCKVGPQTFRSYPAILQRVPRRSADDSDNEGRESSLDTEPNAYFVAYRASGDGYTRYMTKAALLVMPPVYFHTDDK